ncbi:MAG: UDP-3-O-acyl-N-acetylglucosamine deacetylase [Holophagales bacterium]|nr:UDP-3-O-acyl-N-acetylglucosamine deacetylase [Holophagales bacterium]
MSRKVLIIDDEPGVLGSVADVLADEGYHPLTAANAGEGLELFQTQSPDVVFLDIWLPDQDGLEVLAALLELDPATPVVMISGHGTVATAVKAIKMGAYEYLEKPISYNQLVETVSEALEQKGRRRRGRTTETSRKRDGIGADLHPPPAFALVRRGRKHQKTLRRSTVIYGLGLHSGKRTGMVLQPLPPNSGIHFLTLPAEKIIAGNVGSVADTDYATTLSRDGEVIRTVEHLLSALHAYGVSNLLIKVHGEVPVLDGSALEFCKVIEEAGLEGQRTVRQEVVVDREYSVGSGDKRLTLEPYDGFRISYLLRYPAPIGEQFFEVDLDSPETFKAEIAPARTFGFMRDLAMMNELGLGSGGRLDNFILVGEDNVINTDLRFPDEFVRHKILDIIGDLYLAGFAMRAKVTARLTGHRDNIAILRQLLAAGAEA